MDTRIRICIADDHETVLEGLCSLMNSEGDFEVVGTARSGKSVLNFLQRELCDVLILDVNMPGMDGLETCKQVRVLLPQVRILVLSMYDQPSIVHQLISRGASGYLLKNASKGELYEAIRTVHLGRTYIGQALSLAYNAYLTQRTEGIARPQITRREQEVLRLIASECTSQEISERLGITLNTVESHRKNLLNKFGARSSVGLVRMAMKMGLTDTL